MKKERKESRTERGRETDGDNHKINPHSPLSMPIKTRQSS